MWTVAQYVIGNRLRGRERYPLVLMLEPLFVQLGVRRLRQDSVPGRHPQEEPP
jgi:hypothetical protein